MKNGSTTTDDFEWVGPEFSTADPEYIEEKLNRLQRLISYQMEESMKSLVVSSSRCPICGNDLFGEHVFRRLRKLNRTEAELMPLCQRCGEPAVIDRYSDADLRQMWKTWVISNGSLVEYTEAEQRHDREEFREIYDFLDRGKVLAYFKDIELETATISHRRISGLISFTEESDCIRFNNPAMDVICLELWGHVFDLGLWIVEFPFEKIDGTSDVRVPAKWKNGDSDYYRKAIKAVDSLIWRCSEILQFLLRQSRADFMTKRMEGVLFRYPTTDKTLF